MENKPRHALPTQRSKTSKKRYALNVLVVTVATGLIATMSLPAFAMNPQGVANGTAGTEPLLKSASQSYQVEADTSTGAIVRDALSATMTPVQAEAARQQAAVKLTAYASYSGPTVADYLANPPYPTFSLSQVFSVAQKYIGTPYVYGGDTPAGFDCSGFVMFVYAQFGISLPHSVSGEAARGTRISLQSAVPGDLIVMPGHIGFYAGNGNILDAPDTGREISIRPLWTSNFYVVRLGI